MDIIAELNGVFRKLFDNESITVTRSTTAEDIDDWDSITHMVLITAVEQKFGIKFSIVDLNAQNNVGDMIDQIGKKLSAK